MTKIDEPTGPKPIPEGRPTQKLSPADAKAHRLAQASLAQGALEARKDELAQDQKNLEAPVRSRLHNRGFTEDPAHYYDPKKPFVNQRGIKDRPEAEKIDASRKWTASEECNLSRTQEQLENALEAENSGIKLPPGKSSHDIAQSAHRQVKKSKEGSERQKLEREEDKARKTLQEESARNKSRVQYFPRVPPPPPPVQPRPGSKDTP